jgi:hypothetical protein
MVDLSAIVELHTKENTHLLQRVQMRLWSQHWHNNYNHQSFSNTNTIYTSIDKVNQRDPFIDCP